MKIKTSELIGAQLDWAVAMAADIPVGVMSGILYRKDLPGDTYGPGPIFKPSTDWSQGGPLIHLNWIDFTCFENNVLAITERFTVSGQNHLVAACRAIVMEKLGEEIEVPEELV